MLNSYHWQTQMKNKKCNHAEIMYRCDKGMQKLHFSIIYLTKELCLLRVFGSICWVLEKKQSDHRSFFQIALSGIEKTVLAKDLIESLLKSFHWFLIRLEVESCVWVLNKNSYEKKMCLCIPCIQTISGKLWLYKCDDMCWLLESSVSLMFTLIVLSTDFITHYSELASSEN